MQLQEERILPVGTQINKIYFIAVNGLIIFRKDEIHSLSYFVKHEGVCGKRNSTGSATRELDGVDKLFHMISKAMDKIEVNVTDLTKDYMCLEIYTTLL